MATAVLFDLDDTLYSYPPCNRAGKEAAREATRERGYAFDAPEFEAFYQIGREEVKRHLSGTAASHERLLYFKHALEDHTGSPQPADALAIGDAYWEGFLEAMEPFPDTVETLETLRDRGIDVAIVTNLTTRIQLRKLERLGIADHVDLLLTSEEVGREKPDSVLFTLPLARLDRRASEIVMVGNSVSSDIVGANAVGIETVLFNGDVDDPASLEGRREPDHRIDALGAVIDLV
ncbi:HAD family hydrolase [Natronobacterium gregoryi]|uniref:HAD family hydrolase n=2 Tax=Natronobacterium gregoryi TaxID=44930 RepID=L0AFY8_NATGS|nr:HAD family hydrolase [Natronobacterium gregoryi]AFZ71975.1 haloacid dehalogenase superfamily enzyme, subfamily IA [Natronobacterium gregoryi SP2]ELY62661.1 HAD-superfamily hydrolase [Natronobacterium gregoryi SP2]PLK20830.1 HAD family hydrolase [Natronobacterium gregoryi SP2]SFJ19337.1 putative hydrolase of the HAD superfamily [Natronobacterium gregoryi]